MPLLNVVPPPQEKSPSEKVTPGESHDIQSGSRVYTFRDGDWVLEPNQFPPRRDDFKPIVGNIRPYQEVPVGNMETMHQSIRPSTARPLSRSERYELHTVGEEINMCVKFCDLVYMNPADYNLVEFGSEVIRNFNLSIVRESSARFEEDSLCLIAVPADGVVYVVIRGSSSYHELQSSLNGVKLSPSGETIHVHGGFLNHAINGLEPHIRLKLQLIDPCSRLYVTGHGSGGAVATILAPLIAKSFPRATVTCLTFGSPIPGDEHFSKLVRETIKTHYRVVLDTDIFALVPVSANYTQCGEALCVRTSNRDEHPILEIWPEISDSRWLISIENLVSSVTHTSVMSSVKTYCHQICVVMDNL
jgi:hypothetical protein